MVRENFDEIAQKAVIAALRESSSQTYKDIAARCADIKETTLRKALRNLEDTGKIRKIIDVNPKTRSPINRYSLIDNSLELVSEKKLEKQYNRTPAPMKRCCRCQHVREIAVYRQPQKWCKECAKILGLINHAAKTSR